ncbi:MAG: HipA domain-containing protein [Clostridia bacterium]
MKDLSQIKEIPNRFEGSEFKKTIIYENEVYMMKFPDPIREIKNDLSYKNNQFSEDIGCKIFDSCGFSVQETFLAECLINGKKKIVVLCKDFTQNGDRLIEFSKIANSYVESDEKYRLTIEKVFEIIENNHIIKDKNITKAFFWEMFVIDALIGNEDRHFNNWGFLENNHNLKISPIYDCGSCFGAIYSDDYIKSVINDDEMFKNKFFNLKSVYSYKGKRIFYHEIFKNPPVELKKAIEKIYPKINLDKINKIVVNTDKISLVRKEFILKSVNLRYEQIIKSAYKKIIRQKTQDNER